MSPAWLALAKGSNVVLTAGMARTEGHVRHCSGLTPVALARLDRFPIRDLW
jgi:hypothetical protein